MREDSLDVNDGTYSDDILMVLSVGRSQNVHQVKLILQDSVKRTSKGLQQRIISLKGMARSSQALPKHVPGSRPENAKMQALSPMI